MYGRQRNIMNLKHLLRELTMVSKSQTKRLTINFPNWNYLNGAIRTKRWASNPSLLTACYSREILGMLSKFPQPWLSMRSSCSLCTSGRYLLMCENTEQVLLQQITTREGAAVGLRDRNLPLEFRAPSFNNRQSCMTTQERVSLRIGFSKNQEWMNS